MAGQIARCDARWLRWIMLTVCVAAVAACAPVRDKKQPTTAANLAAQDAREAVLLPRTQWTLSAHLGVSNGREGGSGELDWQQHGEAFLFTVRAPNGKTVRLSGDSTHATLEGVETQASQDSDAQRLLRERVGWDVPLAALRLWVLGLHVTDTPAQWQFGANDLPAQLQQDGWTVDYLDWFTDRNPPLPRKVFASRGQTRVKMAIESWSFDQ